MPRKDAQTHDREIGQRLRARRLEIGMSQASLGDALGLTFQQVQKYEKGSNRISAGRLQQMAQILGVSMSFFFDDFGEQNGSELFALLDSAYSLRLLKALANVHDQTIRLRTVELVEAIADAHLPS